MPDHRVLLWAPTTLFEYSEGTLFWAGFPGLVIHALLIPGLLRTAPGRTAVLAAN